MPRKEVDWSVLERGLGVRGIEPKLEFGDLIDAEIAHMDRIIDYCHRNGGTAPNKLVSFGSKSHPQDYFIRCSALFRLLDRYGVLEAYFQ